ncbi:TraR/DksA C4-type zinc finger protein [Paenibacillus pasadenensis]|uniref:TraR/DksA C4-type zinc finger protein n=1 Tax=Paenibacillus pasadenensis TaxID=217090 RepID=UPI00203FDB8C|nr:TraR/DksA C4-type zinc finger protein [Paenibacillus pasadenensis]MCM3746278.1 TraR/DksA C4-type zinc finger protein [Paenibacillus pasadenensis]
MPLSQSFVGRMKQRLLHEREELALLKLQSEHDGLQFSLRDETGELSTIDNHPADVATEMFERGKDLALQEQMDLHRDRVDAALQAIEHGSYGLCLACGQEIPEQRLEALPDTLYCVDHSPRQHTSHRRPAEEAVLLPPFGDSDRDGKDDPGFDGEDAWQVVESWGNSDSPAFQEHPGDNYGRLGIEADENDGYVEDIESFLATDITGRHVSVVRNREYKSYMERGDGEELGEE